MTPYEHWYLIWSAITAIATAGTFAVIITAAILTYRQVREASRARKLESSLAILTHISSPGLRNARRLVYTHQAEIDQIVKSNPSWEALDAFFKEVSHGQVDLERFHSYLASLENVSILVLHDLAPDDIIDMFFARLAPRHWNALTEMILFMRRTYGSDDFLQHFEMLNTLIAEGGLNLEKRTWTKPFPNLKSSRTKRRLLANRRAQRASANLAENIHSQLDGGSENNTKSR